MLPEYPEITDKWFEYKICKKLEYIRIADPSVYYGFQELLAAFLGPDTPYGEILLCFEMGVGKCLTCIKLAAKYFFMIKREGVYKDDSGTHKIGDTMKPMYFAENQNTLSNLKEQMVKFMPELFSDKKYNHVSSQRRENTRTVKQYMNLWTYDSFTRIVKDMTDSEIIEKFNNVPLIILDEIHYARIKIESKNNTDKDVYKQMKRFLKLMKCKKVGVTGTPAFSNIMNFASVFNFILPSDVIPMDPNKLLKLKGDELTYYLAPYLTGRISYMRQYNMPKKIIERGEKIKYIIDDGEETETNVPVIRCPMSQFQESIYMNVLYGQHISANPIENSLNLDLRCASAFVWPDGTYGKSGISTYEDKKKNHGILEDNSKGKFWVEYNKDDGRYYFSKAMLVELKAHGIQKFANKYYEIALYLIHCYQKGRPVFCFNFFYELGVVLIGLSLEWLSKDLKDKGILEESFELYNGKISADNVIGNGPKPRFSIVPNTQSNALISNMRELYNKVENRDASYLACIIGTEKVSTSTNFYNGQEYIDSSGTWTPGEDDQAGNRINRTNSQDWKKQEDRKIYFNYYVSSFNPDTEYEIDGIIIEKTEYTIEERMNIVRDKKRRSISELHRNIKRFNLCGKLFEWRNKFDTDKDYTNETDYDIADYSFYSYDEILERKGDKLIRVKRKEDNDGYDLSTYYFHYKLDKNLKRMICDLVGKYSKITVEEILSILNDDNIAGISEQIIYTIQNIIREDIRIKDSYEALSFIRNDRDTLYLSTENYSDGLIQYYSSSIFIKESHTINIDVIEDIITLFASDEEYSNMMINSTSEVQSYLLEHAFIEDLPSTSPTTDIENMIYSCLVKIHENKECILKTFNYRYYVFRDKNGKVSIVHTIYQMCKTKGTTNRNQKGIKSKDLLRIYTERDSLPSWRFCTRGEDAAYAKKIDVFIKDSINNLLDIANTNYGIPVIGIANTADWVFKILDKRLEKIRYKKGTSIVDDRTRNTGGQFTCFSPGQLLSYLYAFDVLPPIKVKSNLKKNDMLPIVKNIVKEIDIPHDINQLRYYYSWCLTKDSKKEKLASYLEERLIEIGLIVFF